MGKRSFFYKGPRIYKALLRLSQGKNWKRRYKIIAQKIGKNKIVLEPACGPAPLTDFLDKSCSYKGFDINENFIKYLKKRGFKAKVGNAFNSKYYSKADVVVLCDVLHHFGPADEKKVIKLCINSAKEKLIICEPFKDYLLKNFPAWFPGARTFLEKVHDYVDKDGYNQAKLKNLKMKNELRKIMMDGFGVIPKNAKREISESWEDLIATYYL